MDKFEENKGFVSLFDEVKKSTNAADNDSTKNAPNASQNRYSPQQPIAMTMGERSKQISPVNKRKFKLITVPPVGSNQSGRAIRSDSTCCCPMFPFIGPWGICLCSQLKFGPEHDAVEVTYDEGSGKLIQVGSCICSQAMNVDWADIKEKAQVGLFRCGCMPCCSGDEQKFDLLSDGTIAMRGCHNLVLGSYDNRTIQLVTEGTNDRFIFKELLNSRRGGM